MIRLASNLTKGLLVLLLASLGIARVSYSQDREECLSYESKVDVDAKGKLQVEEHIKVRALAQDIKRGIIRDVPLRYYDFRIDNARPSFQVTDFSVTRGNEMEGFHTELINNAMRFYIGKKDVLLTPGIYDYTIRYQTTSAVIKFQGKHDLYLNTIGEGWNFPISKFKVIVNLPSIADPASITGQSIIGKNLASQDMIKVTKNNNSVIFESEQPKELPLGLISLLTWKNKGE